jgi:hypothetical protein
MLDIRIGDDRVKVDLDRLSGTGRALAQAVAAAGDTVDIWMEADQPVRDTTPDWQLWFTADEAAKPERRPWRGWSTRPLAGGDPHDRIEAEAAKIPPGWHVLGAEPLQYMTSVQVLAYLQQRGRNITPATWRAYVNREQAPQARRKTGRTPEWHIDDVNAWLGDARRRY